MEVSELLQRITDDTIEELERRGRLGGMEGLDPAELSEARVACVGAGFTITADEHGWVRHIDGRRLLDGVPDGSVVRLDTTAGRYLSEASSICHLWPHPEESEQNAVIERVRASLHLARTRTLHQDPAYGIRQLADVAVKALSPGVNDPTTAQDAVFHLTAVLRTALSGPEPSAQRSDAGTLLVPAEAFGHVDLVGAAFDEIRRDAAARPTVCVYLLEAIRALLLALPDRPEVEPARRALRRQARLVVDGCQATPQLPEDRQAVEDAYRDRFGDDAAVRSLSA
jgi:uncharacterized membrane protein